MAHVRNNCKNVSTTISIEQHVLDVIEDYRFLKRKDNRSAAITDLILKGLKYQELLDKKRAKMLG